MFPQSIEISTFGLLTILAMLVLFFILAVRLNFANNAIKRDLEKYDHEREHAEDELKSVTTRIKAVAYVLRRKFYPEIEFFRAANNAADVIDQIDNMTTGLVRKNETCNANTEEQIISIIFDEDGKFVEVEDTDGKSINAGTWSYAYPGHADKRGYKALNINLDDLAHRLRMR